MDVRMIIAVFIYSCYSRMDLYQLFVIQLTLSGATGLT